MGKSFWWVKWWKVMKEIGLWWACRKFPEKHTPPTRYSKVTQTLLSVPYSSGSLSEHQHRLVVICVTWVLANGMATPPSSFTWLLPIPACANVIQSTKGHLWLLPCCSHSNFSFSPPPPRFMKTAALYDCFWDCWSAEIRWLAAKALQIQQT